jgi:hypothetical protein
MFEEAPTTLTCCTTRVFSQISNNLNILPLGSKRKHTDYNYKALDLYSTTDILSPLKKCTRTSRKALKAVSKSKKLQSKKSSTQTSLFVETSKSNNNASDASEEE